MISSLLAYSNGFKRLRLSHGVAFQEVLIGSHHKLHSLILYSYWMVSKKVRLTCLLAPRFSLRSCCCSSTGRRTQWISWDPGTETWGGAEVLSMAPVVQILHRWASLELSSSLCLHFIYLWWWLINKKKALFWPIASWQLCCDAHRRIRLQRRGPLKVSLRS